MPPARATSLTARVALGTALAGGLAAVLAAAASIVISDRLVLAAEDRRLRAQASIAVREIAKTPRASQVEDEMEEIAPEGYRLAVFQGDQLLAGHPSVTDLAAGSCASRDADTYRACSVGSRELRVVVSMARTPLDQTSLFLACGLAVLVSAVVSAALGRRAAKWALAPLTRLGASLRGLDEADPKAIAGDDRTAEVAALRAALGGLVARLGSSLDSARRFSADAAHEMKTPLTVLRAELELLAEEPLAPGVLATVEKLRLRVVAISKLVERLLTLANATDNAKLAQDAVAMEDVVRDIVERLGATARERVVVTVTDPGMVLGDETLLGALVENAVDNALKFSAERVELHVRADDGVVVDVTDRGPGIAPADRLRAFEAFFRTPASRASALPGHGVGLALVAQIATAHGGAAELVDPPAGGPGVCLRVRLPGLRRL